MCNVEANLRSTLARCKRMLLNRPFGLRALGRNSSFLHPWYLAGRSYIEVGSNCLIRSESHISAFDRYGDQTFEPALSIGDNVYIGGRVYMTAINRIAISQGCVLSEDVYITDFSHGFDPGGGPILSQALVSKGGVEIGANCFLGYRTAIMPGVALGEWCIVGANTVVSRSFPAYSMIAGVPARLIRVYSHDLRQWIAPPRSQEVA